MLTKQEVGQNIKKAREFKSKLIKIKYTQKMLATDTGLSQSYIGDIESGRSYPSREAVVKIASVCSVSTDFILGETKQGLVFTEEELVELIEKARLEGYYKGYKQGRFDVRAELLNKEES